LRIALATFALATASAAQTNVGGPITTDVTWTPAAGPYTVVDDITVADGATLTIEPGTVVRLETGRWIGVGNQSPATIIARGTPDAPILFTSAQPEPQRGDWGSITIGNKATDAVRDQNGNWLSGSTFEHVVVEYGGGAYADGEGPFWQGPGRSDAFGSLERVRASLLLSVFVSMDGVRPQRWKIGRSS